MNYIIDEANYTGKGANTVVSLLHNYLEYHSLGEKHLHLHADNCVGQNKNNTLLRVSSIQLLIKITASICSTVPGELWLGGMTPSNCPLC